ncbi:DUF4174 domain-containing protein [Pseudoroseicyclus sp. CXY001]|uniref:DUF4174 domain-containing protein n=1 Tax=Pseudoroseicyclus sp. CXY001 TaxID=3242492 RepID=UPI00357155BC
MSMRAALRLISAAVLALAPLAAQAQDEDVIAIWREDPLRVFSGEEIDMDALQYRARPLIIFADSPFDPNFAEQMELIEAGWNDLVARDVIVITDTDPDAETEVRQTFRPRGFVMILIGKDGRIAQRKPAPWATREIAHAIDKLPLRQQEIRETGTLGGR